MAVVRGRHSSQPHAAGRPSWQDEHLPSTRTAQTCKFRAPRSLQTHMCMLHSANSLPSGDAPRRSPWAPHLQRSHARRLPLLGQRLAPLAHGGVDVAGADVAQRGGVHQACVGHVRRECTGGLGPCMPGFGMVEVRGEPAGQQGNCQEGTASKGKACAYNCQCSGTMPAWHSMKGPGARYPPLGKQTASCATLLGPSQAPQALTHRRC